jgi:hypothetical protein
MSKSITVIFAPVNRETFPRAIRRRCGRSDRENIHLRRIATKSKPAIVCTPVTSAPMMSAPNEEEQVINASKH